MLTSPAPDCSRPSQHRAGFVRVPLLILTAMLISARGQEAAAQTAGFAAPRSSGLVLVMTGGHAERSQIADLQSSAPTPASTPTSQASSTEARDTATSGRREPGASDEGEAQVSEKAALIERYFRATRLRASSIEMIWSMSEASPPFRLSASERAIYDEVVREVAGETFDRLAAEFTSVYAEAFTLDELSGLVAFYEGPVGRSLMSKTASLTRRTADLMPEVTAYFRDSLRTRLCARIECSPPAVITAP